MAGALTVACKLPHGLLLQLQTIQDHDEPIMGGGVRKVKRAFRVGHVIKINGCAQFADKASAHPILGGYGLTYGVDAEFFNKWLEQNAEHPAVEGGFIYAHEQPKQVESYIDKRSDKASGLEPVDPRNLPGEFRAIQPAA